MLSLWSNSCIAEFSCFERFNVFALVNPAMMSLFTTYIYVSSHVSLPLSGVNSLFVFFVNFSSGFSSSLSEVLKRTGMQSVHTLLKLAQLRWTGHVTRMPEERLPKKILYGELEMGKRSHGGQKKRHKDTLKASLKDFNIPTESWEQIAQDRAKWQGLIRRGAS